MIFHVGAIWRLNELRYLPKLERVSSVSGGSITAGVLLLLKMVYVVGVAGAVVNDDVTVLASALPTRSFTPPAPPVTEIV